MDAVIKRFEGTLKIYTTSGAMFHHEFAGGSIETYKHIPTVVADTLKKSIVLPLVDAVYEKQIKADGDEINKLQKAIQALNEAADAKEAKEKAAKVAAKVEPAEKMKPKPNVKPEKKGIFGGKKK